MNDDDRTRKWLTLDFVATDDVAREVFEKIAFLVHDIEGADDAHATLSAAFEGTRIPTRYRGYGEA